MSSDSSNARDAIHDQPDSKKEPEGESVSGSGEMQSGKTPQARIMSEPPPAPLDADDESRQVLAQLAVGTVVDGKYRVDQVLGRGAMGVVVQATHVHLGERVALKFLRYRAKGGVGDDFQQRFKREARVSAKLKNEHITRVIDVGVWREHVPYMVMDYLIGTDLRHVIKTQRRRCRSPPPSTTRCRSARGSPRRTPTASSTATSSRRTSSSPSGRTGRSSLKILDFGISKWSADETELDELTQTGVVLGSPKYMAPEQLFGSADVDARADVWSIGAILYEMLCGRPPFDLPTFTKICAELATDRPAAVARPARGPDDLAGARGGGDEVLPARTAERARRTWPSWRATSSTPCRPPSRPGPRRRSRRRSSRAAAATRSRPAAA